MTFEVKLHIVKILVFIMLDKQNSGRGQLTVKGSSNRMITQFQEPIKVKDRGSFLFEEPFTVTALDPRILLIVNKSCSHRLSF